MTLFYFYQPNYAAVIGIDYLLSELHNLMFIQIVISLFNIINCSIITPRLKVQLMEITL
ncbi:hypothetical protein ABID99_000681 [Mucilaginibacter sp. OAE612]